MSKSTLTMIGMYQWNNDLFSQFTIPSGLDKETAIECILQRSSNFEVLYPDFNFMQDMIGLVSKKWARTFQKWYDALQLEYNPIENYDRHEEWNDSSSSESNGNSSDTSSASSETDTSVSTFDSDKFHPDGKSNSSQSARSSGTDSSNTSEKSSHSGHTHGNIGVTTSQQMLEAELDLQEWNLYEHISDIFVRELCIPIY